MGGICRGLVTDGKDLLLVCVKGNLNVLKNKLIWCECHASLKVQAGGVSYLCTGS